MALILPTLLVACSAQSELGPPRDLRRLRPPDITRQLEAASASWITTQGVVQTTQGPRQVLLTILPTNQLQDLLDDRARWVQYALVQEPR